MVGVGATMVWAVWWGLRGRKVAHVGQADVFLALLGECGRGGLRALCRVPRHGAPGVRRRKCS